MATATLSAVAGEATEIAKNRPGRKRLVIVVAPAVPNDATKLCTVMLHHGQIDASALVGLPLFATRSLFEIDGPTAAERWTAFALGNDAIVSVLEHFR